VIRNGAKRGRHEEILNNPADYVDEMLDGLCGRILSTMNAPAVAAA